MLSKSEIKNLQKLHSKKGRDWAGIFLVEGEKLVKEAIDSNFEVTRCYFTKSVKSDLGMQLGLGSEITTSEMKQISNLVNPSPVLACVNMPNRTRGILRLTTTKAIALDNLRDPGNLGTIIRTADWFGINTVFLIGDCVDIYNPKVVQSSMGSFFRVQFFDITVDDLKDLKVGGYKILGAEMSGEKPESLQQLGTGCLVIGNEANGLSPAVKKILDSSVFIRRHGKAESLNAAIAAGILMSAWVNPQN